MTNKRTESATTKVEMPATVRRLVNAILSIEPDYSVEEFGWEDRAELNEIRMDITRLIVTGLYDVNFLEISRFIDFGKVVSGLFTDRERIVFQYDKWYISPFDLLDEKPIEESVFVKKGNRPFLFLWEETVAEILVESYGRYSKDYIGVDFRGKTWINKLNRRMSIHDLVLRFLKNEIYDEDMWELTEYDNAIWFGNELELDNESLVMVNFLAKKIIEIISGSKGLREKIDVDKDILIASERLEEGVEVYWIEFGEYFLIADYSLEACVDVGLLKYLEHGECNKFALGELINNMN